MRSLWSRRGDGAARGRVRAAPAGQRLQPLDQADRPRRVERRGEQRVRGGAALPNVAEDRRDRRLERGVDPPAALPDRLREHVEVAHRPDRAAELRELALERRRRALRQGLREQLQRGPEPADRDAELMDALDLAAARRRELLAHHRDACGDRGARQGRDRDVGRQ